jgi:hypothetical protein
LNRTSVRFAKVQVRTSVQDRTVASLTVIAVNWPVAGHQMAEKVIFGTGPPAVNPCQCAVYKNPFCPTLGVYYILTTSLDQRHTTRRQRGRGKKEANSSVMKLVVGRCLVVSYRLLLFHAY